MEKRKSKYTKFNLEWCFSNAITTGAKLIGVMIQLPNMNEPEAIVNPRANFPKKLEYYMSNYNDNLELKTNNEVKIIGLTYGDTYEEIEAEFEELE